MTAVLRHIFRYPIKSVGGEELDSVILDAGQVLPGDRHYGVMHADALRHLTESGTLEKWLPKSAFLRGAAAAPLQAVTGGWEDGVLVLAHPDRPTLRFNPAGDEGPLLDWLAPLWADSGKAPPARLVAGPFPLTDVKKPYLSLLSLSSLAEVERRLGRPLGMARWRGNLWVDGWAPFAEADLRLARLRLGEVVFKMRDPIDRCPATSADTRTGRLDGDMPAELRAAFGNHDFGIYAEVVTPGTIRPGDPVEIL